MILVFIINIQNSLAYKKISTESWSLVVIFVYVITKCTQVTTSQIPYGNKKEILHTLAHLYGEHCHRQPADITNFGMNIRKINKLSVHVIRGIDLQFNFTHSLITMSNMQIWLMFNLVFCKYLLMDSLIKY